VELVRRALAVLVGVCLGFTAGCGGPSTVEVQVGDGSARVKRGDVLRVDLGEVNASIGDSWYLVEKPDPAILDEGERDYDTDCDEPGCGGRMAWLFTARGPGTTTLVFRYCYRSRPDNCEPQPDRGPDQPVNLAVTVT
jgi:hypothetical protein